MILPGSILWIAHNIGFLVAILTLTVLWLAAMHQVCVCRLNATGTLWLRMSIALALTLEINILCLHLIQRFDDQWLIWGGIPV